jgi:hypothetical protein
VRGGEVEEGVDVVVVLGADGLGDGWGVDVAGAEVGGGDGVEEAGQQASAVKSWAGEE